MTLMPAQDDAREQQMLNLFNLTLPPDRTRGGLDAVLELDDAEADLVPFDAYARAAAQLARPSSLARALESGAENVERIDRLVLNLMRHYGRDDRSVAKISSLIDELLEANRRPGRGQPNRN